MAPFVTVFHVDSASWNLELTCFPSPVFWMPLLAFYSNTIHFGIIRSMALCSIICFALLSKPGTVSLSVCINFAKSFRTKSRTGINSWAKSLTDVCKGKTCKAPERLWMQQVKCPQWIHEDHRWGKERIRSVMDYVTMFCHLNFPSLCKHSQKAFGWHKGLLPATGPLSSSLLCTDVE